MASDPCSLIFRVCGGGQAVLLACVYSEHPLAVTSCGLARLPAASSVPGPANGSAAAGASSQSQARDFRQGQAVAVSEAPVYLDRGLHDPAQPNPAQPSPARAAAANNDRNVEAGGELELSPAHCWYWKTFWFYHIYKLSKLARMKPPRWPLHKWCNVELGVATCRCKVGTNW